VPLALAPDIDAMVSMGVQGGLTYPLYVAVKSTDGQWWMRIHRAPGAEPECDNGTPISPPYAAIAVHEWDEANRRARPRSYWFRRGQLKWIDEHTRGGW
jgi:hypothetical protein